MEIIRRLVITITVVWLVYFAVCYADILAHNLDTEPNYDGHNWNFMVQLFYEQDSPAQ